MSASILSLLPKNYGYVAGVATATGLLTIWQSYVVVNGARKASGVKYPAAYASNEVAEKDAKAMKFNCAQRAHANTMEQVPFFLFSLLFSGLQWPIASAASGALFIVGRVLYTTGYVTGQPQKRYRGTVGSLGQLGLLIGSITLSAKMILATL